MDPARTFKESLTSRPELENSQGQKRALATHSITSSARASSSGGTATSSAFAVLRLIDSSSL